MLFEMDGAKLVLKDLATFHALPIALKMKQPEVFAEKIKKHLYKPWFPDLPKPEQQPPKPEWYDYINEIEECKPYMPIITELWTAVENSEAIKEFLDRPEIEPFVSIHHGDFWCNNSMQCANNDGKLIKNKLIDFQIYSYASLVCDVIFFIWSSVKIELVLDHFDELLDWYYEHFLQVLEQHGCDTTNFDELTFRERVESDARYEFLHAVGMAVAILAPKGKAAFDLQEEDVNKAFGGTIISQSAKEKIRILVLEFGKRGWIRKVR